MVSGIMKPVLLGVAATLIQGALAAVAPWGKCGGVGFTGETTCTPGYACLVQNEFYSQCLVDTSVKTSTKASAVPSSTLVTSIKTSSSVKPVTTTVKSSSLSTAKPSSSSSTVKPSSSSSTIKSTASATPTGGATCPGTFTPISASAFLANMSPGWNLGNTLDAVETEGSWNNPPVVATTFDDVKAAGFKGVRLPVTWAYHFTSQAPDYTVDPVWLQRVSDVIDMITTRGLSVIVNVHHDSWTWMDLTTTSDYTVIEAKFYKLWFQIATKLACKGSLVAFEPINEIPGTTAAHGAEVNKLNGIFLQAISDAGGFNAKRVVTLVGAGEDSVKTSQWFKSPEAKFTNPWAIQYHYYSPYDFIFSAWGKTTWGSDADKASMEADIAAIRGNFTDVPLVIGEWSASPVALENAAVWKYYDYFTRLAIKYNTIPILWDNGNDQLDRAAHVFRDPVAIAIQMNALKGIKNTLPESTTDGATTQTSSAYIYHRANTSVVAQTLGFELNGNTLVSIKTSAGKALAAGTDYTVAGKDVTFTAAFLSTLFTPTTAPGTLATLTATFSAGAPLTITAIQYATPVLGATTSALPATSADLLIPVTWAGQARPATVKAIKSDGGILIDDWTTYLPALQQGRLTYSGQWDWDATHVILRAAVLDAVRAAGKTTTFTIEFWPREPANVANYTITV